MRRTLLTFAVAGVLGATGLGCSDDSTKPASTSATRATSDSVVDDDGDDGDADDGALTGSIEIPAAEATDADRCDPTDPRHCLLPFPSDTFTIPDDTTGTGRRVAFAEASMPVNKDGVSVNPAEWNRNDGFSPGQAISVFIPGIDLDASGIPDVTNIGASLDPAAAIVLLDATTGERWPYWAELDASVENDDDRVLYVRPARNYPDVHRIVVGFRNLDFAGTPARPSPAFVAYRDRKNSGVPAIEDRRARYEQVFADLGAAGVERESLFLAWDFTVASTRNLTEDMLHIRDDAFATLGDAAPGFVVSAVETDPDDAITRRVTGTFEVPLYLTADGSPGNAFTSGASDPRPERNGTYDASYVCIVPDTALEKPARAVVYGHGLLGSNDEVSAGNVRAFATEHNIVFCATKWIGMADEDVPNAITTLADMSNMVTVADRLQQGMLNTLFLARLMKHPDGFVGDAAFQSDGKPVIATGEVFFDGNSQGGIMGGATTAVSTEWTRAVIGVPGMNYSTLLQRSVDWNTYRAVYDPAYPTVIERGLGLSLLQMLWDRGEANGYANHMTTDPLPGTPEHDVLMEVAIGDWQVSQWAANVEARTIGARIHCPTVKDGVLPGPDPLWGIECIDNSPSDGSAIVYWDSGTPLGPIDNEANTSVRDSHEDPRADADNRRQKSEFLRSDGQIIDVCDGAPCTAEAAP